MEPTLSPLVDPNAMWRDLTPEQQARIGAAALVIASGDAPNTDETWNWEAALGEGLTVLGEVYASITGITEARHDLSHIGIRMCVSCGCTDDYGCVEGCSWAGRTLCSGCAPAATPT